MTLVELLAVSAILLMMAGTLGSLALSVQTTNHHQLSRGLALQHAQVTLVRLQRTLQRATANRQFPGFVEFSTRVGAHTFSDTLVVWHPATTAVDPLGLPRIHELVMYCPNPSSPNELWEMTKPGDNRIAPPLTNRNAWLQEIATFQTSDQANRVVLTDLLRVATIREQSSNPVQRAAIRFHTNLLPTASQWNDYLDGKVTWESLPWVQGIYGPAMGLSQARCRIELQLRPGGNEVNHDRELAIPFFGSAAAYFPQAKP